MSIRKFRAPAVLALSLALMATPIAIANANEPVVDTTPAVVQSITPADGALVAGTQTFVIKTDEWVSAYLEWNKGGTWKTDNTWAAGSTRYGSTTQLVVDTTKYGDGKFTLKVNLKNKVNLSTSTAATYTVDNTKPAISWVTPAENAYVRGTVPVTVSATDANPLAYNLRVDSAGLKYTNPYLSGEQSFDWNTTTVADGRHKLYAAATDRATNKSEAFRFVTVDNTMPALTLPQGVVLDKAPQTIHITQEEANPATTYVEINKMVGNKWVKPLGKEFKNVNEFDLLVDPVALGLQDGVKTQIKVTTTDKAGNKTSQTSSVTINCIPEEPVTEEPETPVVTDPEPEPQPEPPAEEETPVVTTPEDTDETTPVEEESNQDPKPTTPNTDGVNTIPAAAFVSNPVTETPTKTIALPAQLAATGSASSVVVIYWAGAALALGLAALVIAGAMRRREMVKA